MADRVWSSTSSTDVSAAGNYQGNAAPVTGDTLTLNAIGTAALATVLPYYTNVLGLTLHALSNWLYSVGVEASGTNAATYLAVGTSGTSVMYIGRNGGGTTGNGSPLMLLDGSSGTVTFNVYKTGTKSGAYPCLCVKGTNVNVNAYGGETGFAVRPGETGTLLALNMLKNDEGNGSPIVRCGKGTTFPTTVRVDTGTLYSLSTGSLTNLKVQGDKAVAIWQPDATGAVSNVDLALGGSMIAKGTGAITYVTARAGCVFDMSQDAQTGKTLNTIVAQPGSTILLDNGNSSSITHPAGGTNIPTIICTGGIGTVKITAPVGMALAIQ